MSWSSVYSTSEVRGLIEDYAGLRGRKDTSPGRLGVLVKLADLDNAIGQMPPKEYQAVLLHGLLGFVLRDADACLGISKDTLHRRYDAGIAWITNYLNGDTE